MKNKFKSNQLYIIILAVVILTMTSVVLIRGIAKQKSNKAAYQENLVQVRQLMAAYQEIIGRHPDIDLDTEIKIRQTFQMWPEKTLVSRMPEVELAYERLDKRVKILMISKGNPTDVYEEALHYNTFSPNGFKYFYDNFQYGNLREASVAPHITGHTEADERIIKIAEKRGYRLRELADPDDLVFIDSHRLQPMAMTAWEKLKAEALSYGLELDLISGFRTVDRQREIFLDLLHRAAEDKTGRGFKDEEIAEGKADEAIEQILKDSSIPGYSKHHTGYTIDIVDAGSGKPFTEFAQTKGYKWLSQNNYLNAKRFGFIPSYPPGATRQGPDPEAWEYVWVGTESLTDPINKPE